MAQREEGTLPFRKQGGEDRGSGLPDAEACAPRTTQLCFLPLNQCRFCVFPVSLPSAARFLPTRSTPEAPPPGSLPRSQGSGNSRNSRVLYPQSQPHLTRSLWSWVLEMELEDRRSLVPSPPALSKSYRVEEGLCDLEAPHKLLFSSSSSPSSPNPSLKFLADDKQKKNVQWRHLPSCRTSS